MVHAEMFVPAEADVRGCSNCAQMPFAAKMLMKLQMITYTHWSIYMTMCRDLKFKLRNGAPHR